MTYTLWLDMDGVMTKIDRSAFSGKNPIYKTLGSHYFRYVKKDKKFCRAIRILSDKRFLNTINIITTVYNQTLDDLPITNEQAADKHIWLIHNYSFLDYKYYCVTTDKNKFAKSQLLRSLCPTDILIDDCNNNLKAWQASGGTAIKYCNGENDRNSFNGICLPESMSAENIAVFLENMIAITNILQQRKENPA